MNKKVTKRALFLSFVSMFLCFTMLLGTTYAWFTDSVASDINTIVAGNLDIEFYHTNKTVTNKKVTSDEKLFTEIEAWEPGAMVWEKLTVKNEGNLELNYRLALNALDATVVQVGDEQYSFADMLKVAFIEEDVANVTREYIKNIDNWSSLVTTTKPGSLKVDNTDDGIDDVDTFKTYTVIIYWQPSENDNIFNMNNLNKGKKVSVKVGVDLYATQKSAENDSFGPDYDIDSEFPMIGKSDSGVSEADKPLVLSVATGPSTTTKLTTLTVPAGGAGENQLVEFAVDPTNNLFEASAGDETVAKLDITYKVGGEKTDGLLEDGLYTVETYISKGLTNPTIRFTGELKPGYVEPQIVEYNSTTGYLKFTTNHFSEYAVQSVVIAYCSAIDTAISEVGKIVDALENTQDRYVVTNMEVLENALDSAVASGTIEADKAQEIIDDVQIIIKNSVVRVNDVYYATFEEAVNAAKAGDVVVLISDVTLTEAITLPAGIIFNGNGKQINGTIYAGGDLTFVGYTRIDSFSASYYDRVITIGKDACLEITGGGRVTVAYGNTFNIIGNVDNAKTADKATVKPSLIVPAGLSITGGNDATFNVTNAYIKLGDTTSKDKLANGKFVFNFDNSIVEFTKGFAMAVPTNGMNPTFKIAIKDSVVTTGTKLIMGAPNSDTVIDNSVVTLGTYFRNSGNMLLKNGSVLTGSTIQFGENGGNDGITTVDNSTFTIANTSAGHALDGKNTGKLVVKNGAVATVNYIVNMAVELDETSKLYSKTTGLTISTADGFVASYEDGVYTVKSDAIKVTSVDELLELLENVTAEGVKIDATGVAIDINNVGTDVPGGIRAFKIPGNVTIKGLSVVGTYRGGNYFMFGGAPDQEIVFEDCTFDLSGRAMGLGFCGDEVCVDSVVYNNCSFKGFVTTNFVTNPNGVATFNNCTFTKAASGNNYVLAMGGTHIFNACTFDYTGVAQTHIGTGIYTGSVNSKNDSDNDYSTAVILDGCNLINCGTRKDGANSTLTVK